MTTVGQTEKKNEIRVRFSPTADDRFRVQFTDAAGKKGSSCCGRRTTFCIGNRPFLRFHPTLAIASADSRAAAAWAKKKDNLLAELDRRV